jgi:thiol-disulfide isomerase/thioredoxin
MWLTVLCACSDPAPSGEAPSRTNIAKTTAKRPVGEAFCDVRASADAARELVWPAVTPAPPVAAARWRWLNIWATWCKPCVEEMPRLAAWRDKLAASGRALELVFVSVDDTDEVIAKHRSAHPDTPQTLRLSDAKSSADWIASLGLDAGAPLPIHVLVDARGRVRCARAGAIQDRDYPAVAQLLAE